LNKIQSASTLRLDHPTARVYLFLAAFLAAAPARGQDAAPESGRCSLADVSPANVALVDDDFDLLLDDGRRVVLAGLEFPAQNEKDAAQRAKALARLSSLVTGEQIFLAELSSAPDRWGRRPASAFASDSARPEAPLISLAAAMLKEGFARFRPDPAAVDCAKFYQAAEAPARERRLGVWATEPAIVFPRDGALSTQGLADEKGLVVITGTVQSIGETRRAAYLNFGRRGDDKFAIMISKRNFAIFEAGGVTPLALKGRRVRVRGLIETYNGLRMEIASPAELELLDGDPAP
jgi:hypothetical protein